MATLCQEAVPSGSNHVVAVRSLFFGDKNYFGSEEPQHAMGSVVWKLNHQHQKKNHQEPLDFVEEAHRAMVRNGEKGEPAQPPRSPQSNLVAQQRREIQACVQSKQWEHALHVFHQMASQGSQVDALA